MTKTFLNQVNVTNLTTQTSNPKSPHEALSSYLVANYLFENIDNRIKFFNDINTLFAFYLKKNIQKFFSVITTPLNEEQVTTLLETNYKLIYKGGNMINFYLSTYRRQFKQLNIQIDLDTLSDFDFSVLINYDNILDVIGLSKTNENYLKLSRLAELTAFDVINHFNNYLFCFQESIVKKSILSFINPYPNTLYYKLGESTPEHIQKQFDYAKEYFNKLIQAQPNPNIIGFINMNIDGLNNKDYNHDLSLLFDIIKQCTHTNIEFVGFALPTTFNKHKQIFAELASITTDNSMKLTSFVNKIINNITPKTPDVLSGITTKTGKIRLGNKLVNLDKRYDRIKTRISETFPSDDSGNYCLLLPMNVSRLYSTQIANTDGLIANYSDSDGNDIGLYNFYSMEADKLTLLESVEYDKFVSENNLVPINYTKLYSSTIHESYEDMVTISINNTLLFGSKNSNGVWTKLSNFNLTRGKIPIRYYLKLSTPVDIDGNKIQYLFVDYLGELIDISTPTFADTNFSHHINTHGFENIFKELTVHGTIATSSVKIFTYTESHLILDLYTVLFETNSGKPWEVPKYEKRMSRVIKLYLSYLKYNYSIKESVDMYNYFVYKGS